MSLSALRGVFDPDRPIFLENRCENERKKVKLGAREQRAQEFQKNRSGTITLSKKMAPLQDANCVLRQEERKETTV